MDSEIYNQDQAPLLHLRVWFLPCILYFNDKYFQVFALLSAKEREAVEQDSQLPKWFLKDKMCSSWQLGRGK